MKKSIDIIKMIHENADTIKKLDGLMKEPGPAYMAYKAGNYKDLPQEEKDRIKTAQAEHDAKICKYAEESQLLKIENRILHDNARRALFNEVVPAALEVWKKYEGKKYGPKTEEKIKDETQAATGCCVCVYVTRKQYGTWQELNISFPYPSPLHYFNYNDFTIAPKWEHGEQVESFLSSENKIQEVHAENLYLWDCREYCENPEDRAREILQAWQDVKNKYDEYYRAVSDYNALIPGKMSSINSNDFKNYMEV